MTDGIGQVLRKLEEMDDARAQSRVEHDAQLENIIGWLRRLENEMAGLKNQAAKMNGRIGVLEGQRLVADGVDAERARLSKKFVVYLGVAAAIVTSVSGIVANILTSR